MTKKSKDESEEEEEQGNSKTAKTHFDHRIAWIKKRIVSMCMLV